APDFENPHDSDADNVYAVQVRVEDGAGGSDTRTINVTVRDVNEPPVIATSGFTIDENQLVAGSVVANDPDLPPQALQYAIVGGPDSDKFTIDSSTGELRFKTAPDFENPHDSDADNVYAVDRQSAV